MASEDLSRRMKICTLVLFLSIRTLLAKKVCISDELIKCTQGRTDVLFTNSRFINLENPEENCRDIYPPIKTCFTEVVHSCGASLGQIVVATSAGAALNLLEYLCSDRAVQAYNTHGKCLESPLPSSKIVACVEKFRNEAIQTSEGGNYSMFCNTVQHFRACLAINVNNSCGPEAARFVDSVAAFVGESALAIFYPKCDIRAPLDNYCYPNPCQNGGVCESPSGEPICACQPSFKGTFCDNSNNSKSDEMQPTQTNTTKSELPTPFPGIPVLAIIGIVLGIMAVLLLCASLTSLAIHHSRRSSDNCTTITNAQNTSTNPVANPQPNRPDVISSEYLQVCSGSSVNSDYLEIYVSQRLTDSEYSYVHDRGFVLNVMAPEAHDNHVDPYPNPAGEGIYDNFGCWQLTPQ